MVYTPSSRESPKGDDLSHLLKILIATVQAERNSVHMSGSHAGATPRRHANDLICGAGKTKKGVVKKYKVLPPLTEANLRRLEATAPRHSPVAEWLKSMK